MLRPAFVTNLRNFISEHKKIFIAYAILCAILIPVSWQQDVYDWYFVTGKALSEGVNVYEPFNIDAIVKRGDTGRWGYPPLFLPFFSLAYVVSTATVLPFHVVYKLIVAFVSVLVAMELEKISKNPKVVPLYLFNPLIIVSTLVQGFLDVLVLYLILKALQNFGKESSAAYMGLSSLCKQTAWPLIPFFLVLNLNVRWWLLFLSVFAVGVIPFMILDFQAVAQALIIQYQARIGITPWSTIVKFANLADSSIIFLMNILIAATQLLLIVLLAIFTKKKLKEANSSDKMRLFEYFVFYELFSLTFVYLLVPPSPHFLAYLLFPTILLMVVYPEFKYPYVAMTIAGYIVFTFDQGLRHNVFHYGVWAGPIYLGYYHLELLIWIFGGVLSIIMYASFFYSLYKIRRGYAN